jgi:glycine cleavage system H protein
MNIPENLKFTREHEWIRVEGDTAYVGITEFASHELGDIVFVEVETTSERINIKESFGSIEAVKTVSEMFMPVTGVVLEFNQELEGAPELINQDSYGAGWIIKISIENPEELDTLLTPEEYAELIG